MLASSRPICSHITHLAGCVARPLSWGSVSGTPRPVRVDTAWLISQQNAEATAGLRRLFYFGALDFKQIK